MLFNELVKMLQTFYSSLDSYLKYVYLMQEMNLQGEFLGVQLHFN